MTTMGEIAVKLTEKTASGTISWQTASGGNGFHANLGRCNFLVSCVPSGATRTPSLMFAVTDEWGFELDRLEHDTPKGFEHPEVQDLYRAAKYQALKIEEKLTEVLNELSDPEFKRFRAILKDPSPPEGQTYQQADRSPRTRGR